MGNSNTKESGTAPDPTGSRELYRSARRRDRPDLILLDLQSQSSRNRERDDEPFTHRETRAEREARKREEKHQQRLKDRERSLKEEHVDGGYLVTLGVYTGTEDYSKSVVRQLQIERKLAPFWRGLNDWSSTWAEHQIIAAARGLPVPAADETPDPELIPQPRPRAASDTQNLTVPMGPRTLSNTSDRSISSTHAAKSSKTRTKALAAALSLGSSRNASSTDLAPKEIKLADDPFVNGQPLEVYLYKNADECPICFLTYPPYLNKTRCCDQPICSECFVQIKRADPHMPEHHPDGEARDPNEGPSAEDPPEMLTSEPSACPYCQQVEFGVTYDPPSFRRGLAFSSSTLHLASTAMSSQTSLNSSNPPTSPTQVGRRRTHSLSANAPNVITTDRVRPDWATKLAAARAHQARRHAAATALHTAAFVTGGSSRTSLLRGGRFSRRNTGGQTTPLGHEHSSHASDLPEDTGDAAAEGEGREGGGARRSARRTRMDELEDMMFMEAVRLSIAEEEERQKKQEKVYRKDAKKRDKEERKAQKRAAKDPYSGGGSSASHSSLSLAFGRRRGNSAASNLRLEAAAQSAAKGSTEDVTGPKTTATPASSAQQATSKGKAVDRSVDDSTIPPSQGSSASLPIPTTGPTRGSSHLRQMSNASSIGSSLADTPPGSWRGDGGEAFPGQTRADDSDREGGSEPLFNYRSLAEMVGVDIDTGNAQSDEEGTPGESPGSGYGHPLPQVKEEKEGEAEAEHVEKTSCKTSPAPSPGTGQEKDAGLVASGEEPGAQSSPAHLSPPPELTITPDTPAALEAADDKRLGHSTNVVEQPEIQS